MKAVLVIDVEEKDIGRKVNYVSVQGGGMSYIVGTMGEDVRLRPLPQEGTEFDVIDTKTGKYADLQKIALKEEWAKGLVYCDMEGFAIEQDGTLILLDECGHCAYPPEGRFKLIWNIGETE